MGYDSHVKINGIMLQLLVDGCGLLQPRVTQLLVDRGWTDINPDIWYPLDDVLQILDEVVCAMIANGFTIIGQRVMQTAECLSEYESFETALLSLDQMYKRLHTGGSVGSIQAEEVEPRHWQVRADTPYPPAFALGILRGLCRWYRKLVRIEALDSNLQSGEFLIHW